MRIRFNVIQCFGRASTEELALNIIQLDVIDKTALKSRIKSYDLVICAVPGFLGYETLKAIIETGIDVVDISFFPEDALTLNKLAIKHKVTAIVDCGVVL